MGIGDALILLAFIITLFLAVTAIIRGYKGMKMSKRFETTDRKVRIGYWLISGLHMWAGILITSCYFIVSILILISL